MNLRRSIIFSAFFCLMTVIGCLPRRLILALGRGLGRLGFAVLKTRAQVALENLQMIYGEQLSEAERITLARKNFAHLGSAILEIIHHLMWTAWRTKTWISLEGEEHLKTALAQGRGAILFSGHLGNFILMGTVLRHVRDLKWLFRDPGDPDLSAVYAWARGRLGITIIPDNPRERSAFLCGMHLKRKKVLGIFIDQVENGGVYVNFMGQPAGSTIGAARLAQMSGAPLLPIHTVRLPGGKLQVIIEPEFVVSSTKDPEGDLPRMVEDMNGVVEKWVRAHPEQWLWGHRRWRKWRK